MRVHGELEIRRSCNIKQEKDYHRYLPSLKKDFHCICGYCGKSELATTKGFEIDHVVPIDLAPHRKCDYGNLVYSCFTCNRKKTSKWPTKNINLMYDGTKGIIDPATKEYDEHLFRKTVGDIEGVTTVGKYMCCEVFKFNLRPMKEIWLYMEICKTMKVLKDSGKDSVSAELCGNFLTLHQFLFDKKE